MSLATSGERSRGALERRRRAGYAQISLCFGCGARCGKGASLWFREPVCTACMTRGDEFLAEMAMRMVKEKEL
jgi:bacterioferritin-associated ferredoxin